MNCMEKKTIYSRLQIWKICLAAAGILFGVMFLNIPGRAATVDFNARMTELQNKFPNEKYWNHVGMSVDNSDGYTSSPCDAKLHKIKDGRHTNGTNGCTCNHFACKGHLSAAQCMGFANKLGYDVFGDTTWTLHTNSGKAYQEIKVGDIVRISGSHSVFIIAKNGNVVTVGEANYKPNCEISWGRTIDLTTVTITNYERADNYATVLGTAPSNATVITVPNTPSTTEQVTTEQTTTEQPTTEKSTETTSSTGFRKAKDGIHQYYYINGKMVKKKWFTVKGKDYYANEKGLILLSQWLYKGNTLVYVKSDGAVAKKELVKIGKNTYFFKSNGKRSSGWKKYKGKYYYCNKKGIVQKKKWIKKGKNRYYVDKKGIRVQGKTFRITGKMYYFGSNGKMVKNKKVTYNGTIYKANKLGQCKIIGHE
ncbi:pneumococcal surface protein PspA [Clostridium sp. CAG:590]|nr:pneumococcal surface protein PspA [Clostridium sp. CAG:590]